MRPAKTATSNIVTFHRVFTAAIPPLRSDKSALGTLPTAAFQYCEPVRTASAYGWYIFPPVDIKLFWDGVDVFYALDGDWSQLESILLGEDFLEYWDQHAPADLKGHSPPLLTNTFVPGIVQIWSGLMVSTSKNWSVLVGPLSNIPQTRHFACFEGLVETDTFKPCPLFINIKLLVTDCEIIIPKKKPLFQVKPVQRECYSDATLSHVEHVGLIPRIEGGAGGMTEDDWNGYRSTVRRIDGSTDGHTPGSYGAERRRRAKRNKLT